ncbi:hypothetical protein [Erythrobacter ani]|uniref:Phage shock protein B n=1 Tax=Erythrobacter ani TaxID=2827235 RepID=A0ABS6SN63_9SPHN|nr:hypothetical protein [Erythrobacter ani]MBV7266465.1 hypothetical protein [Erythrobacter ani]
MEWLVGFAPFAMVLGIIWLVQRGKLEEKKLAATAEATGEKAAQYASRVQELEDRVKVLERIVTDRGYDIATQIEALRDTVKVESRDAGIPLNLNDKEKA